MRLLLVALVVTACHHPSKCERYAAWEAKCGDVARSEQDTEKTLARAMCEAAASSDPDLARAGAKFAKEAECADKTDCDEYKKCRDAVK